MAHVTQSFTFGYFVLGLTWGLFLFCSTTGQEIELRIQQRVCVALKGENLTISFQLKKPPNLTDVLICFDPLQKPIYQLFITENLMNGKFVLQNMTISGKYYCQCETANASWFLRVRDGYFKQVPDYTEVITVSIITGLLLVFSVVGSIYVFRGNWGCCKTTNNESNNERRKEKEDTANVEPAQSTSFYATLETRPRSVYGVLDHSTAASAGGRKDQTKVKTPKKKDVQKTVRDAAQTPDDGCVYENF